MNGVWGASDGFPGSGVDLHLATYYVIVPVVFIYQIIWNVYGLYTLGKVGPDGTGYLYATPPYTPPAVYVFFILANGLGVGVLFAWDRYRPDISLPLLALLSFSLYLSVIFSVRGLSRHGLQLYQSGYGAHVRLARGLIQNGLAVYAAYTTIETLIDLGIVLRRYTSITDEISGIIILVIISGELIVYIILDWGVLEKYMRYIFTPYFVLVGSLAGALLNQFQPWTVKTIFLIALMAVAALAMLVKFILAGSRIQGQTDYILKAAGIKSHTQAVAMRQYPPGAYPYNATPPSAMVPYGMGFTPDPRAMETRAMPAGQSLIGVRSNYPTALHPNRISGGNLIHAPGSAQLQHGTNPT